MIGNLTRKQILLIVIGIIILLWIIYWLSTTKNTVVRQTVQPLAVQPTPVVVQQPTAIQPTAVQPTAVQPITQPAISQSPQMSGGQDSQNTPFILYNFYHPDCKYCKAFSPAWNEVANKLAQNKIISVRAIDVTKPQNENLAFYYNVNSYPTVILVTPDRNIEYSGNRSPQDLYSFVMNNINQYSSNQNQ